MLIFIYLFLLYYLLLFLVLLALNWDFIRLWIKVFHFNIILNTSFFEDLSFTNFNLTVVALIIIINLLHLELFFLFLLTSSSAFLSVQKLFFELLCESFFVKSKLLLLSQFQLLLLHRRWLWVFHSQRHLHLLLHSLLHLHSLFKLKLLSERVLRYSCHLSHLLTLLLLHIILFHDSNLLSSYLFRSHSLFIGVFIRVQRHCSKSSHRWIVD